MKKALLWTMLLLSAAWHSNAQDNQLNIGIESNAQYYVDDPVTGDFEESDPFRSNNYLKAEYTWKDLTAGIQLEGYAPQSLLSYSPAYNSVFNLATYHIAYNKDKWGVDAGYFYEQFGSGLALRAWEDRQLGINNAIRGVKFQFNPTEKISMTSLWGQQRIGFQVSKGQLFGFNTDIDLSGEENSLILGASYVGRYEKPVGEAYGLSPVTHVGSLRMEYSAGNYYTRMEGVVKSKDALVEDGVVYNDKQFYGNAFNLEFGYSQKGLGANANLRRLENMSFYADREAAGNTYNELVVNYLPALSKIHDYTLANIYVYQAQPSLGFFPLNKAGEIGGEFNLYYKFKRGSTLGGKYGTKVSLNYSDWYGLAADYNPEFRRINVKAFGFGEHYFRDANMEIRKKINRNTHVIFTYINAFYNKTYIEEREGKINFQILAGDVTYKLGSGKSLRMDLQHLWTAQDKKNWAAGTLEFNFNSHLSFFTNDMWNYGNDDPEHRNHYYNVGGSYTQGTGRYAISYGRTRGGLLCVGGVCREVPSATGLSIQITKSF